LNGDYVFEEIRGKILKSLEISENEHIAYQNLCDIEKSLLSITHIFKKKPKTEVANK
jgi:hypothetical protein